MQVAGFALIPLDISDFPTRHNYGLALRQEGIERTLAAWVDELAVPIHRGLEVTGFAQDDTGVDVELSDGRSLRAKYLVGCDGGRSLIRKKAGIDFPGWDPSISYLIAEVEMTEEPAWGIRPNERGINALGKLEDGKRVGVVLNEPHVRQGDEPTLDDLREALVAVYGTDFGVHNVTYLSRFTDAARQAASYRERRVLLAGDAAHVHSPGRRTRTQHRCPGRREPGMEAGPGGQRHIAGEPARYLPGRAAPDRCARAQDHHGANGAHARRRTDEGLARDHVRAA